MSNKPAKLAFHVKQLVNQLSITEHKDETVDILVENLKTTYKEYSLEQDGRALRSAVSQALNTVIMSSSSASLTTIQGPGTPSGSQTPKRIMSLNQMVSRQYQSVPSKRHRPNEEAGGLDNDGQLEARMGTDIDSVSQGPSAQSSKKRSKVKGSGKTAAKEPREDDSIEGEISNAVLSKSKIGKMLELQSARPTARLVDLTGIDSITAQVKEMVFFPILYPQLYNYLGVRPPCGLLLHGPSGCGKTALANAIAGELGLPFFKASGPELIGGTSGESEERVRNIFEAAATNSPSVLFIDAIDVIAAKKDGAQRGMDRRIIAQLFDSIDMILSLGEKDHDKESDDQHNNSSGSDGSGVAEVPEGSIPPELLSRKENKNDEQNKSKARSKKEKDNKLVVLIAATNKADNLDPGVRGRFSREISLPVPDAESRSKILSLMARRMRLAPDVSFEELGRLTPGFVGADLKAMVREAGMLAVSRLIGSSDNNKKTTINTTNNGNSGSCNMIGNSDISVSSTNAQEASALPATSSSTSLQPDIAVATAAAATVACSIETHMEVSVDSSSAGPPAVPSMSVATPGTSSKEIAGTATTQLAAASHFVISEDAAVEMSDFVAAAKSVQPTAKREGFAVVPNVTWGDVGALAEVREELLHNVLEPISHPERFRSLGLEVPAGVLFFGPPGCGKTLLAKALANQSGANFISVKGPELLNMYVGESESRVRQVFSRARASAPCVIFFDELDALCPRRGTGAEGGSGVSERVVNQLLTELDGLETRKDVYIIAATNRLELIDDAMLRPGRLGKLLYVPLPTKDDRISILTALTRKVALDESTVDVTAIGSDPRTEGFSGADLSNLVREAGLAVVRELSDRSSDAKMREIQDTIRGYSTSASSSTIVESGSMVRTAVTAVQVASTASVTVPGNLEAPRSTATAVCIGGRHFEAALRKVRPSVTMKDRLRYEMVHKFIRSGMGAVQALNAAAEMSAKFVDTDADDGAKV